MEYELYADVWFLTNFVMDCIALEIAGRLMKQRIRFRSLVLAGIAGSAGSLILFLLMRRYLWYQLLILSNCCPVLQRFVYIIRQEKSRVSH